ncbi:MAG: 3-deoxy-7-phosphoheptulonate synthase, partial [Kangiellaceae bacterium]|nr:3-deoxy-7-phosphoheptulonate synthase [Kangiellaceae bacterium]
MSSITSNVRIDKITSVESPNDIIGRFPSDDAINHLVIDTRQKISDIIQQKSDRLLVIVGPCSVHDPKAAIEYAGRLAQVREHLKPQLEVVMRVYFEKPRTTIGWKGLINDPDLNGSFNVNKGLATARETLLEINRLGVPAATEFLDVVTGQYYSDLISWGAIGARTTESQIHRELASGLSCPVGFKNGTDGNIQIAFDAVNAAKHPHSFLSPIEDGTMAVHRTRGNKDAHVILRGGKQPNYNSTAIAECLTGKHRAQVTTGLVVDFSHANSQKDFRRQMIVGQNVAEQIRLGQTQIVGAMIESHLQEGKQSIDGEQPLTYGQ